MAYISMRGICMACVCIRISIGITKRCFCILLSPAVVEAQKSKRIEAITNTSTHFRVFRIHNSTWTALRNDA